MLVFSLLSLASSASDFAAATTSLLRWGDSEKKEERAVRDYLKQEDLAPRARFELATLRLTAECSTIELPGNGQVDF